MHPPWPVTSMPDWLASIGLGHLTPLMLDNGIAEDVLTSLTEADLEKLGIGMGDRKRLMRAIAELAASESSSARPVADSLVPNTELRQLTIMFCDLVDATALCARLTPEQWRQVVLGYQQAAVAVITRYGGTVAQYLGDGLLVSSATRRPLKMRLRGPCMRPWSWCTRWGRWTRRSTARRACGCKCASASTRGGW